MTNKVINKAQLSFLHWVLNYKDTLDVSHLELPIDWQSQVENTIIYKKYEVAGPCSVTLNKLLIEFKPKYKKAYENHHYGRHD